MLALIRQFIRSEAAATAMEYGVILGLIGASILIGISLFYTNIGGIFSALGGWFSHPTTTSPNF